MRSLQGVKPTGGGVEDFGSLPQASERHFSYFCWILFRLGTRLVATEPGNASESLRYKRDPSKNSSVIVVLTWADVCGPCSIASAMLSRSNRTETASALLSSAAPYEICTITTSFGVTSRHPKN
jgi:hypothetical protein